MRGRKQGNNVTYIGTGNEYRELLADLDLACSSIGLATSGVLIDDEKDHGETVYSVTIWVPKKELEHVEWMHDRLFK